jgi:membrane-associated phospholipid phosphatase
MIVPATRFTAPQRVVLGSCSVLLVGWFMVLAIFVHQHRLDAVDVTVQTAVHVFSGVRHGSRLEPLMAGVSLLGSGIVIFPCVAGLCGYCWRGRRRLALAALWVTAGSATITEALKWLMARPRPHLTPTAFPSGHVIAAVMFFGGLVYLTSIATPRRGWRTVAATVAVVVIGGVSFSRLYLDQHWFTDVIGGLMIGMALLLGALIILDTAAQAAA